MIPKETKERLARDEFMRSCCVCGSPTENWHHNLIFQGRKCQEWWSILPVCRPCHDQADNRKVRKKLNEIMIQRAGNKIKPYEKVKRYNRS